jgi:hypothetical protein
MDSERAFTLSPEQIALINPNTKTAPVFRSKVDAELCAKIYQTVPILINDSKEQEDNPWNISFLAMFHMSGDSGLFRTEPASGLVPLYEAKMNHQFNHRWATYNSTESRYCTLTEKQNPAFETVPRYWISELEVNARLSSKNWNHGWLMGWRDICRSTDERTLIATVFPRVGCGDKFLLMLPVQAPRLCAALLGCLNSLACDFSARQKLGGTSLKYFTIKQFPILPPSAYGKADLDFIVSRVLELTYTSHSLGCFARDLGYDGPPFAWNEERRAMLRAELDSWYARAYGLTRDELRYILDPADVMGEEYPSETFRVLKNNDIKQYGEYRTQRLVLEAWDRMEAGTVQEVISTTTAIDLSTLSNEVWERPSGDEATLPQLAAIIWALPSPTPIWKVRLAALYALEPRYLTNRLTGAERVQWLRLVGSAANPIGGTNVTTLISRVNAEWGQAVAYLRSINVIDENTTAQTWAPGDEIHTLPVGLIEGWPSGRAGFVLKALEAINFHDATTDLPTELQDWVTSYAAA